MKKSIILLIFAFGAFINLMACDITFTIVGDKKDTYKIGDEIVIEVQVKLIHRQCAVAMKDTKFTYEGLKIEGATEWTEKQAGVYIRKIKTKLITDNLKEVKLTATRKCNKDGGYGVFTIKKA
jgi:hypothetical protein